MTVKGFPGVILAAADFIIVVAKPTASQAEGEIGFGPEAMDETEFGIQIHGRDRQPQREIGAQKIRLVMIIKGVTGERRVAFEGLIVTELNQVTLDRVNLGENQTGG